MKVKPQSIVQGVLLFFAVLFFATFRPMLPTVAGGTFVLWTIFCKVWAARHEPGKDLIGRAKAGDPAAQVELGLFKLKRDDRYGKSQEEAVQLFHAAAEQGDAEGCYQYGLAHDNGTGSLMPDLQTAIQWWKKAAKLGHAAAMSQLADCYELGECVKKSPAKAPSNTPGNTSPTWSTSSSRERNANNPENAELWRFSIFNLGNSARERALTLRGEGSTLCA